MRIPGYIYLGQFRKLRVAMRWMILLMIVFLIGSARAINQYRVCSPYNMAFPYTGYTIDIQFNALLKQEFHLYMCKEGRIMLDIALPASTLATTSTDEKSIVPWGQAICNDANTDCFKLARRKSFALRSVPIFFPGTSVGAIFESPSNTPVLPLLADNLWSNQWMEAQGFFKFVYHFPLFYTPNANDRKHPSHGKASRGKATNLGWAKHISPEEKYDLLTVDSRFAARRALDSVFACITKIANFKLESILRVWGTSGQKFNPLVNFFFILRFLTKEVFFGLVNDIDKIYNHLAT